MKDVCLGEESANILERNPPRGGLQMLCVRFCELVSVVDLLALLDQARASGMLLGEVGEPLRCKGARFWGICYSRTVFPEGERVTGTGDEGVG